MDAAVREFVRERAGNRCEYCLLEQKHLPFSTFQVEHIIPRKHGGDDAPVNPALACDRCNSHKGTNLTGIDPETGEIVPLCNPRQHLWEEHFRLSDVTIARFHVKASMAQLRREWLGISEDERKNLAHILDARQRLSQAFQREPTVKVVSQATGLEVDTVERIEQA
jgi:5-methylcytosine-specific restriction endonuclease McrA